MVRIGLMGCGVVAGYGHLPAIAQVNDVELYAVFDPDHKRVSEVRDRYNVPHAYTNSDEFFQSGIDAVTITSPAPVHIDNVLDAARYGKHVLCEKPLAMNANEAQTMIDAMEKANKQFYVGFCYRFAPSAIKIKELIQQGAIGEPLALRLVYLWDCHGKYYQDTSGEWAVNRHREGRMLEGGPMVDCGVHQIDLARWWLDSEVVRHSGHGAWVDYYEAPDHMWVHMDHDSGAHSMIEMSYSYGHTTRHKFAQFYYEIIGRDGMILYDRSAEVFELRNKDRTERFNYEWEKNFIGMYYAFAHAIKTGDPGYLGLPQDAMRVTEIARTATDQCIDGRVTEGRIIEREEVDLSV